MADEARELIGEDAAVEEVRAGRFTLIDRYGRARLVLGTAGDGAAGLQVYDEREQPRAQLVLDPAGAVNLKLHDREGEVCAWLAVDANGSPSLTLSGLSRHDATVRGHAEIGVDEHGCPVLSLHDREAKPRALLSLAEGDGSPSLGFSGLHGTPRLLLAEDANGGLLYLYDHHGRSREGVPALRLGPPEAAAPEPRRVADQELRAALEREARAVIDETARVAVEREVRAVVERETHAALERAAGTVIGSEARSVAAREVRPLIEREVSGHGARLVRDLVERAVRAASDHHGRAAGAAAPAAEPPRLANADDLRSIVEPLVSELVAGQADAFAAQVGPLARELAEDAVRTAAERQVRAIAARESRVLAEREMRRFAEGEARDIAARETLAITGRELADLAGRIDGVAGAQRRARLATAILVVVAAGLGLAAGLLLRGRGEPPKAGAAAAADATASPRMLDADELVLRDREGGARVRLGTLPDGSPFLQLAGRDGKSTAEVSVLPRMGVALKLASGKGLVSLGAGSDGSPRLRLYEGERVLFEAP